MSKIGKAFKNGRALIAFITCGDPDLETTAAAVRAAAENGADMIELGIPFSDPTAEGPVLQEASIRALQSGVTTDRILEFVKQLRADVKIPLVFMTYANVVFSYGAERFMKACAEAEVSGLILPDLPYEEKEEFADVSRKYGVDLISVIAYNSGDRIEMIAREAEGFIYLHAPGVDAKDAVKRIKACTDTPCAVYAGVSAPGQAAAIGNDADGVIVDEAVVGILAEHGRDAAGYIGEYVKAMKEALK